MRSCGGAALRDRRGTPEGPSCPLCLLIQRSVERALRALLAEFVNDPPMRLELRKARGFCSAHTVLLASLGDPLAVAILYADLAEHARKRWVSHQPRAPLARLLRKAKRTPDPPPGACPACRTALEAEQRYLQALANRLDAPEVWQALEAGRGLCVPHAEQVMEYAPREAAERLRRLEERRLALLQSELEEIIRKNDYRFRQEPWGPEKDAWLRALNKLRRP